MEEYLAKGPGFIFLFHPALGPLWDVIAQKIRGGTLADGAELVLQVASCSLCNDICPGPSLLAQYWHWCKTCSSAHSLKEGYCLPDFLQTDLLLILSSVRLASCASCPAIRLSANQLYEHRSRRRR